jgi:hypothetical protein
MKTAVATFAYPAPSIDIYAKECLHSLAKQTDRDFSLFVFNDGLASIAQIVSDSKINAEIVPVSGDPAAIRRHAIRHLIECGFDIIVFADIDDLFDVQRVEVAKKLIQAGIDIVVNELILFGQSYPQPYHMLEGRLKEGDALTSADIRQGNCLGMSNTALRTSAITDKALEAHPVTAFDWFFYTNILANGASAKFTAKVQTLYRQHANNIAPIHHLDDTNILRGLKIKHQHFHAMSNDYAKELAHTIALANTDDFQKQAYCRAVRSAMRPQPFWWEPIKTFKELGL